MPKSKNRKDHAKKVAARNQKINQITSMKKKQMAAWLQQLQAQVQAQNAAETTPTENIIDVSAVEDVPVVTDVENGIVGESGQL